MRAAQTALRHPALQPRRKAESEHRKLAIGGKANTLLFGTLFLLGYLPGVWLGGNVSSVLGQQLASYYAEQPGNIAFIRIFETQFAILFLQLSVVLLCGFCALGAGWLVLFFAARGIFLGFCAASAAVANGVAGVMHYRAVTAFSDIAELFLCVWLAGWSAQLANELFRALRGRATRETAGTLRRLLVRTAAALGLSLVLAVISAVIIWTVGSIRR